MKFWATLLTIMFFLFKTVEVYGYQSKYQMSENAKIIKDGHIGTLLNHSEINME